jgi:hypothetical protein
MNSHIKSEQHNKVPQIHKNDRLSFTQYTTAPNLLALAPPGTRYPSTNALALYQVLSSTAAFMREAPSSPSPIQHQIAQIDIDYTPGPHF